MVAEPVRVLLSGGMTRYYGLYAALLSLCAVVSMYWFSDAAVHTGLLVSPQGCRMSWMSPHYVLQAEFNATWTPLARRYTLWLYREKGFEDGHTAWGVPVLFIPGNAGSSRQVRSIASSAARQYYRAPGVVNESLANHKPLDIYTVDYNEDFSAIHAPTLLKQADYAQAAIQYILSQYPPGTSIILMGHSMGGIVATTLLARGDSKAPIRAVITMSTPALLSPVRFDRRMKDVYTSIRNTQLGRLQSDQAHIPLVAICGGATDPQVGSEACAISFNKAPYRRTVYTTSAEGVWTGVDHLAMVWCHQVRSLLARVALELANAPPQHAVTTLQKVLMVDATQVKHDPHLVDLTNIKPIYVPIDGRLRISEPSAGLHLLPVPPPTEELASGTHSFTLFVLGGNVYNHRSDIFSLSDTFKVKVLSCDAPPPSVTLPLCRTLGGEVKLIPNPPRDAPFPAKEGVPEAEGLFVFEASVPASKKEKWVGVMVEGGVHREGWVVAGFDREEPALLPVAKTDPFGSGVQITLPHWLPRLHTRIRMPHVLSNALLVYRLHVQTAGECQSSSFPPLIAHEVSEDETQWSNPAQAIYLHSHRTGPFVNSPYGPGQGLTLRVYSSGECGIQRLELSVAWKLSLGRFGVRYWQGLAMYCVAVVGCLQLSAYRAFERGGDFPTMQKTMQEFTSPLMTIGYLTALALLSIIPAPRWFLLGNEGEPLFAWIAPAMWIFATGLIATSIYVLDALKFVTRPIRRLLGGGVQRLERSTTKRHIASILGILILVWTLVPYQVAFLATFFLHIGSASTKAPSSALSSYVQLNDRSRSPARTTRSRSPSISPSLATLKTHQDAIRLAQDDQLLLLLLWLLLPFAAPVLAVWVRTLQTAGFTVPFDGDNSILRILPWLLLGEAAASRRPLRTAWNHGWAKATTYILGTIPLVAVLLGPRYPFVVYEVATVGAAWLAVTRIQWGRI